MFAASSSVRTWAPPLYIFHQLCTRGCRTGSGAPTTPALLMLESAASLPSQNHDMCTGALATSSSPIFSSAWTGPSPECGSMLSAVSLPFTIRGPLNKMRAQLCGTQRAGSNRRGSSSARCGLETDLPHAIPQTFMHALPSMYSNMRF
jgi:hypothetical protein